MYITHGKMENARLKRINLIADIKWETWLGESRAKAVPVRLRLSPCRFELIPGQCIQCGAGRGFFNSKQFGAALPITIPLLLHIHPFTCRPGLEQYAN
jgi:hypothetical protein